MLMPKHYWKNDKSKKVIKHLKGDIETFKDEAQEDRKLIRTLKKPKHHSSKSNKIATVLREFKHKKLHSGSKKGPKVTNRKQAVAIALSEARKKGARIPRVK